ncbi:MAG: hypothetical protein V7K35_11500 [Nostoc sp.]|uniref:hypothetical protein n=1 Tax=Nostoc sp. TaxID=1180 RepID=UPI002FF4C280
MELREYQKINKLSDFVGEPVRCGESSAVGEWLSRWEVPDARVAQRKAYGMASLKATVRSV